MKTRIFWLNTLLALMLCFFFVQCSSSVSTHQSQSRTEKMHPNDPFKSTMVPSQFFDIQAKEDNVVEGKNGTRLVIPKGSLLDADGNAFEGNANIELAEALSLKDMIQSNLTTLSDGKPLITDGMIYINATAKGEQLTISTETPIYIEIPTIERKPGMMAYEGVRDEHGNMNWINPKKIEQYLIPVDIHSLDFYPPAYEATVESIMPFNGRKTANKAFKDSVYFSLSFSNLLSWEEVFHQNEYNYNEPHHNKNKQVVDGKYSDESYDVQSTQYPQDTVVVETPECGVDPASVKVIWSNKYQNTLLATREFESRMKWIHEACQTSILEIYVNNLDRNLWELDSMAADKIMGFPTLKAVMDSVKQDIGPFFHDPIFKEGVVEKFREFSRQRLTKVKGGEKYAEILKGYYEEQLKAVKVELEANQAAALAEFREETPDAKQKIAAYKELLWKRESYRMETYGFEWSSNGWINVDIGTIPKTWGPQRMEVMVENTAQLDRVYTYIFYNSIKSLYRLNTSDNHVFYVGNAEERAMNMPKKMPATVISVGYKGETLFLATSEFLTGAHKVNVSLNAATQAQLDGICSKYEHYATENRISVDLEYQAFFAREKKKKIEKLEKLKKLILTVFKCCNPTFRGEDGPTIQSAVN